MRFYFSAINLWCNKNLVDLEFVLGQTLKHQADYDIEFFENPEEEEVEYVIINTCWFLSSSREESEQTIAYYDQLWKKIILMGCYLPLKNNDFLKGLKNLYALIPFKEYNFFESFVLKEKKKDLQRLTNKSTFLHPYDSKETFIWKWDETRAYFNAVFWYEYLKIAEGCDNHCSFCLIPRIRGKQKSRRREDIVFELQTMLANGVKEICILSQDTLNYGKDLYEKRALIDLLHDIDRVEWDFEYKLFYVYPDMMDFSFLEELKKLRKFIPYFDIPFQHISPQVLKRMGRYYDDKAIYTILDFIRENFPLSFIHTNFIIGFPWETEWDFEILLDFIEKYKFESISVFEYHDEALAPSYKLGDKVPSSVAKKRLARLKILTERIYKENKEKRKGKIFTWYIMEIWEKELVIRSRLQAPEIDEYDKIAFENIISWEIQIGERVKYRISE